MGNNSHLRLSKTACGSSTATAIGNSNSKIGFVKRRSEDVYIYMHH